MMNENSIILYNLDNNKIKQDKILELIPEIRKYYSFSTIIGASEPTKAKKIIFINYQTGETVQPKYSVEDVRDIMKMHTESKEYNIYSHNCHLAQQRTREALGLQIDNAYCHI